MVLHGECWQVRVCGNRLMNASSHAILIRDDLLDLTVENNEIELARGFAIGTLSNNVVIQGGRIAHNRIRGCGAVTFGAVPRGAAVRSVRELQRRRQRDRREPANRHPRRGGAVERALLCRCGGARHHGQSHHRQSSGPGARRGTS